MNGDGGMKQSGDETAWGCGAFVLLFMIAFAALVMSIVALVLAGC